MHCLSLSCAFHDVCSTAQCVWIEGLVKLRTLLLVNVECVKRLMMMMLDSASEVWTMSSPLTGLANFEQMYEMIA